MNPPNCGGAFASDVKPKNPIPGPPIKPTEAELVPRIETEFTSLKVGDWLGVGEGDVLGEAVGYCVTLYVAPAGISDAAATPKTSSTCVKVTPPLLESATCPVDPSEATPIAPTAPLNGTIKTDATPHRFVLLSSKCTTCTP
jgi:hypothetical protein